MIPMKEILRELTGLSGVSGHEGKVADFLLQKLCGYTDDIHVDRIGNISVHLPSGRPGAAKVVVFGHMDEIGMIVKQIDGGGFLRFERIGGVHRQILPGTPVIVETESGKGIEGVIGVKSHHIIPQEEKNRVPDIEDLYIDIGSKSREDTLGRGVQAGDLITFKANWQEYGNGIVSCKSLDDRAADVILLSLIDLFHGGGDHPDLYIVFSVTEEFNIRGILPVIRRIQPDICIGVDITPAYDTPDLVGKGAVRLGGGPAVTYLNFHGRGTLAGHIYNEKLNAHFCRTAEECGISIQREVCIGVVTETGYICFEGTEGIITGSVSIPMRYTHTPLEMVSLDDLQDIVTLLYNSVKEITSAEDFKPNNFTGNRERGKAVHLKPVPKWDEQRRRIMKKIIVACAGGVATSTLICDKVENLIRERKLDAEVYQCRISEIKANLDKACVILCSARLEEHYSVPVLQALPFITGVGLPEMSEKLIQIVKG